MSYLSPHPVIANAQTNLRRLRDQAYAAGHYRSGKLDPFVETLYLQKSEQAIIDVILDVCEQECVRFVSISDFLITLGGLRGGHHGHPISFKIAKVLGLSSKRPNDTIHPHVGLNIGSLAGVYDVVAREKFAEPLDHDRLIASAVNKPIPDGERPDLASCQITKKPRDFVALWREIIEEDDSYETGFLVDYEYHRGYYSPSRLEPDEPGHLEWTFRDDIELTSDEEFWLYHKIMRELESD